MDTAALRRFALEQMDAFGLLEAGWTFRYDGARRRFGVCRFSSKVISLSRPLVELNSEAECRDTVLHEIAHALAGPAAGHGPHWRAMCVRTGADPRRCYDGDQVQEPEPRYQAVCPSCGHRIGFHRRPSRKRACAACCRLHSGGSFDDRFLMKLVDTQTRREVTYSRGARAKTEARCPACRKLYAFRKRIRTARACGDCCRQHAGGRYDERFRLQIIRRT